MKSIWKAAQSEVADGKSSPDSRNKVSARYFCKATLSRVHHRLAYDWETEMRKALLLFCPLNFDNSLTSPRDC